jgi:hypothetical protein
MQDLGAKIRQADPRVKYAHPNWIVRLDPTSAPPSQQLKKLKGLLQAAPQAATPNDPAQTARLHWHYEAPPGA